MTCRDHLGQTLPDHRCHPAGRPEYSQSCHTDPCPTEPPVPEKTYKWKTASWTTVGELNATSTETTLSDARSDTNTTASFTLETSLSSPIKTSDSVDKQTITDVSPPTTVQLVTLTPGISMAEHTNTTTTVTTTTSTSTTPSSILTTLSTALDLGFNVTSLYASSITNFTSAPVNVTMMTIPTDPDSRPMSTASIAAIPPSSFTVSTTELSPSIGSSTSAVSTVTTEPHRPVTFDWNSYTSPYGTNSVTPSSRYLSTSASARLFPVSLPHRPTYAYFANYYRFDSPTVRHSRRPTD